MRITEIFELGHSSGYGHKDRDRDGYGRKDHGYRRYGKGHDGYGRKRHSGGGLLRISIGGY